MKHDHPSTEATAIRPGVRQAEKGKVTDRLERAIDDLLERRAELYRRLAQ